MKTTTAGGRQGGGPGYSSIYRQGSGESSYSQRSSDLSLDEEREHFRRDTERQALAQLEKGRAKPVAFAVKTNVAFDGSMDDDSPVHGSAVSFAIGDYLHVMERYDQNWWIGRKVQIGADIGFIPSPAKLETLRIQQALLGCKPLKVPPLTKVQRRNILILSFSRRRREK